jgi:hypothetical protein
MPCILANAVEPSFCKWLSDRNGAGAANLVLGTIVSKRPGVVIHHAKKLMRLDQLVNRSWMSLTFHA